MVGVTRRRRDRRADTAATVIGVSAVITSAVEDVVQALRRGSCVGVPTDTVYGIGARLDSPEALESLFAAKGRSHTQAIAVLVDSLDTARTIGEFDERAVRIVERWWPGPLTVVVRRVATLTADLGGDPSTIGVRVPRHELIAQVVAQVGPLATTSANRAGEPSLGSAGAIVDQLGHALEVVFDGGSLGTVASTVIDLTGGDLRVLREGAISATELERFA